MNSSRLLFRTKNRLAHCISISKHLTNIPRSPLRQSKILNGKDSKLTSSCYSPPDQFCSPKPPRPHPSLLSENSPNQLSYNELNQLWQDFTEAQATNKQPVEFENDAFFRSFINHYYACIETDTKKNNRIKGIAGFHETSKLLRQLLSTDQSISDCLFSYEERSSLRAKLIKDSQNWSLFFKVLNPLVDLAIAQAENSKNSDEFNKDSVISSEKPNSVHQYVFNLIEYSLLRELSKAQDSLRQSFVSSLSVNKADTTTGASINNVAFDKSSTEFASLIASLKSRLTQISSSLDEINKSDELVKLLRSGANFMNYKQTDVYTLSRNVMKKKEKAAAVQPPQSEVNHLVKSKQLVELAESLHTYLSQEHAETSMVSSDSALFFIRLLKIKFSHLEMQILIEGSKCLNSEYHKSLEAEVNKLMRMFASFDAVPDFFKNDFVHFFSFFRKKLDMVIKNLSTIQMNENVNYFNILNGLVRFNTDLADDQMTQKFNEIYEALQAKRVKNNSLETMPLDKELFSNVFTLFSAERGYLENRHVNFIMNSWARCEFMPNKETIIKMKNKLGKFINMQFYFVSNN